MHVRDGPMARACLGGDVHWTRQRRNLSVLSIRVRAPYTSDIQIARHRCRVTLIDMYGMNQAYNAGGGDPSAQVPNHLVSAPAAVRVARPWLIV